VSDDDKQFEPSAQKLKQAREQGNLARSKLFTASAATLGGLVGTLVSARTTAARLGGWARSQWSLPQTSPEAALRQGLDVLASGLLPTLAGAMLGALASAVATAGLGVQADLVLPKLERVDPFSGFKKLVSPKQALEVAKGLAVAGVLLALAWRGVVSATPLVLAGAQHDGAQALTAALSQWQPLVLRCAVALLGLGVADFAWARQRHHKELMMSREEMKQEHKNSEGDPHAKAHRKHLQKQLAQGGRARSVKQATAVVVNPTHIAIALRYDEAECDAPYIVARGREEDAMSIRREAQTHGVPIVKDVPLARSLIHYDVGEEIPEELYRAAAAVLKVAQEQVQEGGR
jgi:type III secretion protein U